MSEEKASWIETLRTIRRFHPVAIAFFVGLTVLFGRVVHSPIDLIEKMVLVGFMIGLVMIMTIFEGYRIDKEEELKEQGLGERGFLVNYENRVLHFLGVSNQQATHIRLVKGVVRVNPHLTVLCPTLANGGICHRGGKHPHEWHRPKLLIKNHGNQRLQLWRCEGCKDKFLLRVNV